jgi:hypothetical protein
VRVAGPSYTLAQAWALQTSQATGRVAAHQSSPTDRPVEQAQAILGETRLRRPSQHTFDIRV